MLIDAHAHLTDEKFSADADEAIEKAKQNGVGIIVDSGADRISSENACKRATARKEIYCTAGVHPEYADKLTDDDLTAFKMLWKNEKTVAIGEIGLDYHYEQNPDKEAQKQAFLKQLKLADELSAPIVVHIRDAHGDAIKLLRENQALVKNGILVHCYSGSKELAQEYAKFGAFFSFGGVITFPNAKDKPDVIRAIDDGRILLETDCPYMTPVPMRGKRNEPAFIPIIAEKMAEILGKTTEEIANITTNNALNLFGRISL